MFCPFVNGDCVSNCAFKNDSDNCNLANAISIIKKIESNTGSDQTDSWYINNRLGDVIDKLDILIKKL